LIAMAVLSIGMISVAAMQMSAIRGNARALQMTERSVAASNHMERLLNLPYSHADLTGAASPGQNHTPEADGVDNDGDGDIDEADDDGEFNYSVSWIVIDDTANRKTIIVSLIGNSYGQGKTMTVKTTKVR